MGDEKTASRPLHSAVSTIMKAGRNTQRAKYIALHAAYCQQEQSRGNADIQHFKSSMMLADMGTKSLSGPAVARFLEWAIGARAYPGKSDPQYKLLHLQHFAHTDLEIISSYSSSSSKPD